LWSNVDFCFNDDRSSYMEKEINMSIAYLKKMNSYQIARELFDNHGCDPDVASIAAWWVHHKEQPKNWAKYLNTCYSYISKLTVDKRRLISKEYAKFILKNYEENKILNKNQALLGI